MPIERYATNQIDEPPHILVVGNAASPHVRSRARAMLAHCPEVVLLSPQPATLPGLTVLSPQPKPLPGLLHRFQTFANACALYRLLRRVPATLTHAHSAYTQAVWLALIARTGPLVISCMGGDVLFDERTESTRLGRALTRLTLNNADLITVKSRHMANALNRMHIPAERIRITPWGIDTDRFRRVDASDLRKRLGLREDDRVLLSPRHVAQLYNISLCIEAMPDILQTQPTAKLVILQGNGDESHLADLRQLVTRLDLEERVLFVPCATHAAMPEFYSLAEATISMASSDGIPQCLPESMACGTPCILNYLERFEEFVSHEHDVLFTEQSAPALAAQIQRLLSTPQLCENLSAQGKITVQRSFSLKHEAAKVARWYAQIPVGSTARKPWPTRLRATLLFALLLIFGYVHAGLKRCSKLLPLPQRNS